MNKKIELVLYIALYALFGFVFVKKVPQSEYYFLYTLAIFMGVGVLFVMTRYYVSLQLKREEILKSVVLLGVAGALAFAAAGYFWFASLRSLGVSFSLRSLIKEVLPYLAASVAFGLLHLINPRKKVVKRIAMYLGVGLIILSAGFLIKYQMDVNYKGDDSIHFMSGEYHSFNDIINQQQFRDKVIYVDLWFSSCGPCILEFKKLPAIKEELKGLDVEYLYLARETSHPNSFQLWKNAIRKYDLEGWHVYMADELRQNIWTLINEGAKKESQNYPHYLLIDHANEIASFNARKPSDDELLVKEIRDLASRQAALP